MQLHLPPVPSLGHDRGAQLESVQQSEQSGGTYAAPTGVIGQSLLAAILQVPLAAGSPILVLPLPLLPLWAPAPRPRPLLPILPALATATAMVRMPPLAPPRPPAPLPPFEPLPLDSPRSACARWRWRPGAGAPRQSPSQAEQLRCARIPRLPFLPCLPCPKRLPRLPQHTKPT